MGRDRDEREHRDERDRGRERPRENERDRDRDRYGSTRFLSVHTAVHDPNASTTSTSSCMLTHAHRKQCGTDNQKRVLSLKPHTACCRERDRRDKERDRPSERDRSERSRSEREPERPKERERRDSDRGGKERDRKRWALRQWHIPTGLVQTLWFCMCAKHLGCWA